jgi:hypothetical protein
LQIFSERKLEVESGGSDAEDKGKATEIEG